MSDFNGSPESQDQPDVLDGPGSVANPFLNNIPAEDRAIVEKYVKDWDANVTKKFQSIHEQYKPYKDLGDYDMIRSAVGFVNYLNESPLDVYDLLGQQLEDQLAERNGGNRGRGSNEELKIPQEYEGMPPAAYQEMMGMREMLNNLVGFLQQQNSISQAAEEDRALDETLKGLEKKYGAFDEEYVLAKMYAGMEPEKAVQAYQQHVQGILNNRASQRAPAILGGSAGSVPIQGRHPSQLSGNERRAMVAQMLEQAHQQT